MGCHLVGEKVLSDYIVTNCYSNVQLADNLTKSLMSYRIEFIGNKLGAYDLYAPA